MLQGSTRLLRRSAKILSYRFPTALLATKTGPAPSKSKPKSWVPTEDDSLQKITMQALVHEVSMQQMESAAVVVPWFLKNMPESYFRQTEEDSRKQHLKAIQAIRDLKQSDLSLKIETRTDDGRTDITYISSTISRGLLNTQIAGLKVPDKSHLSRVKVFSSLDNQLSLNIFSFYDQTKSSNNTSATRADAKAIFELIEEMKAGKYKNDTSMPEYNPEYHSQEAIEDYLSRISSVYVKTSTPKHFILQNYLFHQVHGTDNVAVDIQSAPSVSVSSDQMAASTPAPLSPPTIINTNGTTMVDLSNTYGWITIAASNVLPEVILKLCSTLLSTRNLAINRAHLDIIRDESIKVADLTQSGYVTMLRLLVSPDPLYTSTDYITQTDFQTQLMSDIKRLKWIDEETIQLGLKEYPSLGLGKAEIITALCSMLHGPLYKINNQAYGSIKTIIELLDISSNYVHIADSIATLFLERFKPSSDSLNGAPNELNSPLKSSLSEEQFKKAQIDILSKIKIIQHESVRILLTKMLETLPLILRTNYYHTDRYALSFRIHPSIMVNTEYSPHQSTMPYGIIFVHGRHFNGFHCRFRDIARGGLRIVTPNTRDMYIHESSRQFDEVYGLSYAQQLKNKDIPEGGSKAVILVNSPAIEPNKKVFAVRKSMKAFIDSMLDLIVKDSVNQLVDYLNKDEIIYLGPDEQIIPWDIDWIIQRAEQRGYPIPAAFMSSKKGAGINHKEYGVTSEGIVVYLDVALKHILNIDPRKQSFTIKITGGPDGDVAGNLIRILYREYGQNCKIVGIADGFGVAEDPNGLDSNELLRLVQSSLSIIAYDKMKLSTTGILLDANTEEGLLRRAALPFKVKSDAFIPAGGRPNTINKDNWHQYIDENTGKPSSPLIVEGANIFNTLEAREQLFKHAGVVIVKDSSANKCGVITSSCEVAASMLLSKEEFMTHKTELVNDVIHRLRYLARQEAELLFRLYKNYPGALPHFSERISFAIAKMTDAITDSLQCIQPEDPLFKELFPLIKDNLPTKLATLAWDRVPHKYPIQYQKNAIASTLASHIVYKEGIHWIESIPMDKIADKAYMYYRQDNKIEQLIQELQLSWKLTENDINIPLNSTSTTTMMTSANEEDKKKLLLSLLKQGGARTSLEFV